MALTPAKERFAAFMAEGWKQARAIREVGRTPQTASTWMKDPEVLARIKDLRENLTEEAMRLLRGSVVQNTQIILDIAKHGGEVGVVASQLRAATWALERILKPAEAKGEGPSSRLTEEDLDHLIERGEAEPS